jgi:hypothetical protein
MAGAAALLALAHPAVAADERPDPPLVVHDYLLSCGGCHELDGSGSARVPTLRAIDRLLAFDGGRDYVLRVPGVAQAPLSDARLAALLNWLFDEFGSGAPTPRFTAAEVGAARSVPFDDPKAARAALR